jgi:phytoene dehydrogenase-like protein
MLDLELKRHGLEVIPTSPGIQPFEDGRSLIFWPDVEKMCDEIRSFSAHDAQAYPQYIRHMEGLIPHLRQLLFETPVDPASGKFSDLVKTAAFAFRFKSVGAKFYDLWDLLTLSAYDFLRRWFESPEILTVFGCYASGSGGNIGPKSPGSAYVLARPFLRDGSTKAGPGGLVKGGMGSISQAMQRCAQERGVTIRVGANVAKVIVQNRVAKGVQLSDGEIIEARAVVSNASAQTLFLRLTDAADLPQQVINATRRIRTESSCFKINLAASEIPKWAAMERRNYLLPPGSITIAENLTQLQTAFESASHGEMAARPYLWILTPSAFDPSIAPPGKHTLSIFGGHVPYKLRGGIWDEAARERLLDIVLTQIERYAPGLRKHVLHHQVLVPPDLEEMFDLPGGHVHHGELSIDQIFFRRPIAHYANYKSPIAGLYLCGASTHPGGGVTGVPGHNASRVIAAELKSRRGD